MSVLLEESASIPASRPTETGLLHQSDFPTYSSFIPHFLSHSVKTRSSLPVCLLRSLICFGAGGIKAPHTVSERSKVTLNLIIQRQFTAKLISRHDLDHTYDSFSYLLLCLVIPASRRAEADFNQYFPLLQLMTEHLKKKKKKTRTRTYVRLGAKRLQMNSATKHFTGRKRQ